MVIILEFFVWICRCSTKKLTGVKKRIPFFGEYDEEMSRMLDGNAEPVLYFMYKTTHFFVDIFGYLWYY